MISYAKVGNLSNELVKGLYAIDRGNSSISWDVSHLTIVKRFDFLSRNKLVN